MDCPSDVLRALLAQYEALTLLKDLSVQADLARYDLVFLREKESKSIQKKFQRIIFSKGPLQ